MLDGCVVLDLFLQSVTESVVTFLEMIPPFQFLPGTEIRALARSMTQKYFPKEGLIKSADSPSVAKAMLIFQCFRTA